jgi:membrane protein DedA with SNARE-associated domain
MISLDTMPRLIETHGLVLLVPLSILEGPIVTVIASYAARLGYLNIYAVFVVCVLGDLIGDGALYWIGWTGGPWVPPRTRTWLGMGQVRTAKLVHHFRVHGGRTLILGKITHSAGFLVLLAAGAAKMPFGKFLLFNTLGTLPKTAFFCVIGYTIGHAYASIDGNIAKVSAILLITIITTAAGWWAYKRGQKTEDNLG